MRLGFLLCSTVVLASFALGCEEPVPPTPTGAFLVNFLDTGAACPQKTHSSTMGVITATAKTTLAVDGVKEADIACSVKGAAAGPFAVEANMTFQGTEILTISVPKIDGKATDVMPAQGSIGFASSITAGDFYSSDQPCDFYIEPAGPSGIGEGLKPGSAWLSFKCPSIVESNSNCGINESYVYIENCSQ